MGRNTGCPSRRETAAPATTTASGDSREGTHRSSTFAYPVFGVQVGAVGQGELHRRHMAVFHSVMEGRLANLRGGKERDKARAMREHETRHHSTGGHD